jgi:hypothetical protein
MNAFTWDAAYWANSAVAKQVALQGNSRDHLHGQAFDMPSLMRLAWLGQRTSSEPPRLGLRLWQVYAGEDSAKAAVVAAKHAFEDWAAPLVAQAEVDATACYAAQATHAENDGASACSDILNGLSVAATKEATSR